MLSSFVIFLVRIIFLIAIRSRSHIRSPAGFVRLTLVISSNRIVLFHMLQLRPATPYFNRREASFAIVSDLVRCAIAKS